MKTLRDKIVIVTGAGSGIGRALAVHAAELGSAVGVCDVNEVGLAETASLVKARGARVLSQRVDVASKQDIAAFAQRVNADLGAADVIVCNAGVSVSDSATTMSDDDLRWIVDINFWGVVETVRAFMPQLLTRPDAHVVTLSSIFGIVAMPTQSAYNATKFAVRGYTESLRQDLRDTRVHVTCVHPGGVKTNIVAGGRHHLDVNGRATTTDASAREFARMARTTPDSAARQILHGVLTNKPRVLVGADAKVLDLLQRLLPAYYDRVTLAVAGMMDRRRAR